VARAPTIGPGAIGKIHRAVDEVFDRVKVRVLGPQSVPKRIYVSHAQHYSIPGIFGAASKEEGVVPNLETLQQLLQVAGGYVDSLRERTKARVVREVQAALSEAHRGGVETDLPTVLGGRLSRVWSDTVSGARKIIDAEVQHTKNIGLMEGALKISAAQGVDDPVVFFVVVRDGALCAECKRLHLLEDGAAPRVWKLSEVGSGYHRRGDPNPKVGGLHPHCRCQLTMLSPGYGFSAAGMVQFVGDGHDEWAAQRRAT
jgi:hypothetical protein